MRIAVSGSTGFLGANILRALETRGIEVVRIARHSRKEETDSIRFPEKLDSSSSSTFIDAFADKRIDGVVHAATHFSASSPPELLGNIVEANLVNPILLAQAAKDSNSFFVNLNSLWQVIPRTERGAESVYASTKEAFRIFVSRTMPQEQVLNVFVPDTFGPADRRGKVVESMLLSKIAGKPLKLENPRQKINLSYGPFLANFLGTLVSNFDIRADPLAYINFRDVALEDLQNLIWEDSPMVEIPPDNQMALLAQTGTHQFGETALNVFGTIEIEAIKLLLDQLELELRQQISEKRA